MNVFNNNLLKYLIFTDCVNINTKTLNFIIRNCYAIPLIYVTLNYL